MDFPNLPAAFLAFFSLSSVVIQIFFVLSVFLGVFLFWRAAKHDLIKTEESLDSVIIAGVSALVFSRVFDFVFKSENYGWSIYKLLFFNAFPGADFWGAVVGAAVGVILLSKVKKMDVFVHLDLMAAPILFALGLISLGGFISRIIAGNLDFLELYFAVFYIFAFFVLKRLSVRKRKKGFFASLFLILVSIVNIISFLWRESVNYVGGLIAYELAAPIVFLILGIVSWHVFTKRKVRVDVNSFFAGILLAVFKAKRILTTLEEADSLSKTTILAPYFLARKVYALFKYLAREVLAGFLELLYTLGLKK